MKEADLWGASVPLAVREEAGRCLDGDDGRRAPGADHDGQLAHGLVGAAVPDFDNCKRHWRACKRR
jgi:hypothetical protein